MDGVFMFRRIRRLFIAAVMAGMFLLGSFTADPEGFRLQYAAFRGSVESGKYAVSRRDLERAVYFVRDAASEAAEIAERMGLRERIGDCLEELFSFLRKV